MSINITKIQVFAKSDGKNTLGYAHITLEDTFVVKNLRVVKGKGGLFVGMPANKTKRGDYFDIFFPITQKARLELTQSVIDAFRHKYPELVEGLEIHGMENEESHSEEKEERYRFVPNFFSRKKVAH